MNLFSRARTRHDPNVEFTELRRRCIEGSSHARRTFIRRYEPLVWQTVISRFGTMPREDQEEVVADTFIALLSDNARLLARYNSTLGLSPQGYIRRQAILQGYNRYRKLTAAKRQLEVPIAPDNHGDRLEVHRDHSPGPEDRIMERETLERTLDRLRNELSPPLALTFELLYVRQLDPGEAAKVLGCSLDVVYQRKRRLLKAAKRILPGADATGEGPR